MFVPAKLGSMSHHAADDHERRWADAGLGNPFREIRQRPDDRALPGERAPLDQGGRGFRVLSALDEGVGDLPESRRTHVEDQRPVKSGQARPVDLRGGIGRIVVASHQRGGRGLGPVGDRQAGVGCHTDGRRHSRHDPRRDAVGVQMLGLLGPAAEDERVAPLQPHDPFAGACVLDEQVVDPFLGDGGVPLALAREDPQAPGGARPSSRGWTR